MKIYLFTTREDDGPPWVSTAWDDFSANENDTGFDEAIAEHEKKYGARFRLAVVEIPDDFLPSLFKPKTVEGATTLAPPAPDDPDLFCPRHGRRSRPAEISGLRCDCAEPFRSPLR